MVKFRFYAVAHGRERGVFRSWPECEARVKGFANAVYKAFATEEAAHAFVQSAVVGPSARSSAQLRPIPAALRDAFPMGSQILVGKRQRSPTPPRRSSPLRRKKSPPAPAVTHSGPHVEIFVDGACASNGRHGARGGFGGYYGDGDERNFSIPLSNDERQSNNRGELRAIEYALTQELEAAERSGVFLPLHIHTDSKYCLDGIHSYMPRWKSNGFITTGRQPVEHQDLWKSIDRLTTEYCRRKEEVDQAPSLQPAVQFSYVKGHSGNRGNAMADRLAVRGAAMQWSEPARTRGPRREAPSTQSTEMFSCSLCDVLTKTTLLLPCRHVICRSCAESMHKPQDHEVCLKCGCQVERFVDLV